jgi:hypothetical protein
MHNPKSIGKSVRASGLKVAGPMELGPRGPVSGEEAPAWFAGLTL